jgi:hypothetical protein
MKIVRFVAYLLAGFMLGLMLPRFAARLLG